MGTNATVEIASRKRPESSGYFQQTALSAENSRGWFTRLIDNIRFVFMSSSRWALVFIVMAIACVAYADSKAQDVTFGYLYVLPLSFGAILLSSRVTYALVAASVFCHDFFGPPIHHGHGRILHNVSASVGFIFVVVLLQRVVAQRNSLNDLTRHHRDELLKEVELAAQVQRLFLPRSDSETTGFEIAGTMYPARGVSGDYYDYIARADGSLRLVIADVSGKGAAAALLMSATAAAIRLDTSEFRKLCDIAERLNDGLYALQGDSRFVTVLLGEFDPQSGRLRYINCGHNPAVLLRAGDADPIWLGASCTPVGIFPQLHCAMEEITLAPADIMVWYTDGLTDATDSAGREFGIERVLQIVRLQSSSSAREICDHLRRAVAEFTQRELLDDDLTVMVTRLKARS